jgi:hypothetical protein
LTKRLFSLEKKLKIIFDAKIRCKEIQVVEEDVVALGMINGMKFGVQIVIILS